MKRQTQLRPSQGGKMAGPVGPAEGVDPSAGDEAAPRNKIDDLHDMLRAAADTPPANNTNWMIMHPDELRRYAAEMADDEP